MILSFLLLGETASSLLGDEQSFTLHYRLIAGLLGAAGALFVGRMMKGLFVRQPIKAETHL
jgi:hypothetical protein